MKNFRFFIFFVTLAFAIGYFIGNLIKAYQEKTQENSKNEQIYKEIGE